MSFYGKIYEQMGNIFNRVGFKNKKTQTKKDFPTSSQIKDFVLQANSEGDKLTLSNGNSWIALVETPDANDPLICSIYHQPAQKDLPNTTFATISKLDQGYFFKQTASKKEEIKKSKTYINFGDKITFDSLQYDEAGHVYGVESEDYVLAEIPNLDEILAANDNIQYLLLAVGEDFDANKQDPLLDRTAELEKSVSEIEEAAEAAEEAAKSAAESAEVAKEQAANAAGLAESAVNRVNSLAEDIGNLTDSMTASSYAIQGIASIIGPVEDVQNSSYKDIVEWLTDLTSRIKKLES